MERNFAGTSDDSKGNAHWRRIGLKGIGVPGGTTRTSRPCCWMQCSCRGRGVRAELLLGERNCETNAASRNFTFSEALDRAERDQIAEAVEPFAPASARANELQPFPVAKTARLNSQNAPCFSARVALSQARRSPASEELCRMIMHPLSIRCDALCCGNVWKSNRTRVDRCPGQ